jgi:hypothetical protein
MTSLLDALQNLGNGLSGVLIGAVIGIYATVVFQRYVKFKDIVADLAYRIMTIAEQVGQIEHGRHNPAQLWVTAAGVIQDHIKPCYFQLAIYGHDEAKNAVGAQLNQILDGLFKISNEIANRPAQDPELIQVGGDRSFWVTIQWGFYLRQYRDRWTGRMMEIQPNWTSIFVGLPKSPPEDNSNII